MKEGIDEGRVAQNRRREEQGGDTGPTMALFDPVGEAEKEFGVGIGVKAAFDRPGGQSNQGVLDQFDLFGSSDELEELIAGPVLKGLEATLKGAREGAPAEACEISDPGEGGITIFGGGGGRLTGILIIHVLEPRGSKETLVEQRWVLILCEVGRAFGGRLENLTRCSMRVKNEFPR